MLVFQGVKRPALLERDEHAAGAAAIALAAIARASRARACVFNHDWVPYEERGAWLLEADLGVSAHPAHLETRFAYRTRIADYLWAGLPVVTSAGDVLGDLVAPRGLGRAVPPGDDAAFAAACAELLADRGPARANVRRGGGGAALGPRRPPAARFLPYRHEADTESAQGATDPQRHHRPICTHRHGDPVHRRTRQPDPEARRRTRGAR